MANTSIKAAFERMWQHITSALSNKSDISHNHNDIYYTESEIDTKLQSKSDTTHNHDAVYDAKGAAAESLASAKSYTDTKTSGLASTTIVDNKISAHNTSTASHSDIRDLIAGLTTRLNALANSDDTTLDQMSEIVDYIKNNKSLIDGITTNKINVSDIVNNLTTNISNKPLSAAQGVAIKALIDALQEELDSHTHAISDVSGLQSALDGKAASSHGTHVSYSSTAPVMDGTASVGTASTVARSDHKHPTDTSRASKTEFDTHTSNTTAHITSTERNNWNAAKSHADSAHAPSNAEKNQNAFSNITVGSTTVAADSATDTVTFVGSNVTITPDATNDKITFEVSDASTGAKGVVKLTNSTSSTSTTTAATPSSVKSAYDLANTAKKNAATAQERADSAYALAEGKVDSLSDLGVTATATELNYVDGVTSNVQTQLDGKAEMSQGVLYIEGDSSSTTDTTNKIATWIGSHDDITAYFSGLTILYKVPTAGSTTTTLNINGLGAVNVVRNATTGISTACPVSGILLLTYTIDSDGTAYWKTADYDSNTKTTTGTSNKTATKLYLAGATSQSSSGTTTYSNKNVYIGTDNCLYSNGAKVATVDSAIANLSVSGKTITYTKGDGTTVTINTQDTDTTYSAATTSSAGLMSAADKTKLDGVATGANNYTYTLPNATSSVLGGVKVGSNISVSSGTISLTKANVTSALGYTPPTTNTTYSNATTSAAGLMSASDKTKLDGINLANYLPLSGGTVTNDIIFTNGNGVMGKDKDGTAQYLMFLSTSNTLNFGYNMPSTCSAKFNIPISGTLHLNSTTDASSTADNNAALIIGNRSGEHLVFDGNEIIPKSGAKAGGTLYLGDSENTVISISGKFRVNSYSYGTSLPAAGTAGRIFFKKV